MWVLGCSAASDSITPWALGCQALLSMEFSRQEYWSGLPFPPPDFPTQGLNPWLLFGRQILYHSATWEAPPDKLSSWNGEKSSGPTVVVLKDWSSYLGSFS